jgi:hypothetical protein
MKRRLARGLLVLLALAMFSLLFWFTATLVSRVPRIQVVSVNVHGLTLAGRSDESQPALAPLSLAVLDQALQDASPAVATAAPSPSGSRLPISPAPTPKPTPSASSSPSPFPTPTLPATSPTPTPASAGISGQVTDSQTRTAIVGATVSLSPGGALTLTDANGYYSFSGLAPGSYTVTASAAGYNSASQTVTLTGSQKANLNFRLISATAYGSLDGTVTDAVTGTPIVGAAVSLSNGLLRTTDLNGNFSYPIVLNGSYTLTVSALGYITQSQVVTIKPNKTTNVQVALAHA